MVLGLLGVGGGHPGRAGDGAGAGVDGEVGLGEPAGVGHRRHLGHQLGACLLHRFAHVAVGVGHVPEQGLDLDTVDALHRLEQRDGPLAVGGVAGPHVDAQDQLGVLVADDVELVAVEAPGGRLAAVAHLGVGVGDDPVAGHALADLGIRRRRRPRRPGR